ncbi:MAG: alanine racemase, partial [Kiloniellales bacterium]
LRGVPAAPVVKADAYGLGAARVGPALARAGAQSFFVAQIDEGIALRKALADDWPDAGIAVLVGPLPGAERDFLEHNLLPVLNSLEEVDRWRALAARDGRPLQALLHIDSGMSRLGLPPDEVDLLADDPGRLQGITLGCVMSHLACAEAAGNPMNRRQREAFVAVRARLPAAPASLANSSGIFLGPDYHFDLARPGAALYGVNPTPTKPNPMVQVIRLQGKILQARTIDAPQSVGYGAAHRARAATRVATVGVGYADGYLRSLSNRGTAFIEGQRVAVIGRVSMDLITLDVTALPEQATRPGTLVELIDPERGPDALAEQAGTIGYEILTALGRRYHRIYLAD